MDDTTPQAVRAFALSQLITMEEFFRKAGIDRSTFYAWEHGRTPKALTLAKIKKAMENPQ